MIFNLKNEYERVAFKEYVNKLYTDDKVVEVKKVNPKRSLAQNRYLFLLLGYFGLRKGYTLSEVKECIFKKICNEDLFKRNIVCKENDSVIEMWRSTADLTTAEMALAIDRFRNWSSAIAGEYLPEANEYGYILNITQQLEEAKEYIVLPY